MLAKSVTVMRMSNLNNISDSVVSRDEVILVTGANGFIGFKVLETLLQYGYRSIRCFGRAPSLEVKVRELSKSFVDAKVEVVQGNLLNRQDCDRATVGVSIIYHLAAGNEKSFAGCYMNSAVTTRNLLEAARKGDKLKRFVNVSSFAVYSNIRLRRHSVLDEQCEVETKFMERGDAYCFGKVKQEELVIEYWKEHGIPYVILRPGAVYGPGVRQLITPRVGIDTFGIFLHLGGRNRVPLTYIDNCADAIVLAGLKKGVDQEIFNVVDDNPPRSSAFLRKYKRNVGHFRSIYIPYRLFFWFCVFWEKYWKWSDGQFPLAFNRYRCSAYWKGNEYPNSKLRSRLGWTMRVSFEEGAKRYFDYLRLKGGQK